MPIALPTGKWTAPCLFCAALEGTTAKGVVEETPLTATLVNGRQFEEGQVIVVPRRHAPTLLDLTDEEMTAVAHASRRVADALMRAYDPAGITVYQMNGVASGQEVAHYHMHVVPRHAGSQRWGSGPPQVAVLMGMEPRKAEFDPVVSLDREMEIAAFIQQHLRAS